MKIQNSGVSFVLSLLTLACAVAAFGPVARWLEARNTAAPAHRLAIAPVSLEARVEGENLRIVWDRNAAGLQQATGGAITIEDGPVVRKIPLSADQLRTSSGIVYVPRGPLIKAELRVESPDRKTAAPSVVVVVSPGHNTVPIEPLAAPTPWARVDTNQKPANHIAEPRPQPTPARLVETAALKQSSGEGIRYYSPAAPTYAAKPNLPGAMALLVAGTVQIEVRIKINARGDVTAAMPVSQTGSLRGSAQERALIAHAVIEAARKWTFVPARIGAQAVPSEVVLSFTLSKG